MYAIIETGGKQYKVEEGMMISVEKLEVAENGVVVFDNVLAVSTEDGLKVGSPLIEGAKVEATLIGHGKGRKIIIYKYKSKKGYHKKKGHRQPYTKIKITSIKG